jgi:Protein of unknown function (DUF2796)
VKRIQFICYLAALSAVAATSAAAEEHEHRQHGAHVHGEARLDVALDGSRLDMDLDTPAINVLGFEHPPMSPEESDAVARATRLLNDGATLFVPAPAAECRLAEAKVTSEGLEPGAADADEEADHEEADHDAADHDEGEEEGHHHHAEFQAAYHFECGAPDRLTSLEVRMFGPFPGTHKVHVQLITPKVQTAAELTADQTRMTF